jgi:hypothetical protein
MALSTYTELKAAVADWLNRTDLTSAIDYDFLPLCEAELKRRVRRTTKTGTIYVATAEVSPPSDMAEPISLRLDSGSPYQDVPLTICTPQMLAEVRARHGDTTARPTHVAYYNSKFQFAPEPDQSYDCTVVYVMQFTALSGTNTTNAILTEAPDAYLYGCLLQAAPYLEHDERIPIWQAKFDAAISQLNQVRDREEYGGGIGDVRLPVVFG